MAVSLGGWVAYVAEVQGLPLLKLHSSKADRLLSLLGASTHLPQLPCCSKGPLQLQAHVSNHCSSANWHLLLSSLCSPARVPVTHMIAQGSLLFKGDLLNSLPISPFQSTTFAPQITFMWAHLARRTLSIATTQFNSHYDVSAYYKKKYLTYDTGRKLCLRAHPLFLSCHQMSTDPPPLLVGGQLFPSGHSHQDCICLKWEKIVVYLPGSFLKQQQRR